MKKSIITFSAFVIFTSMSLVEDKGLALIERSSEKFTEAENLYVEYSMSAQCDNEQASAGISARSGYYKKSGRNFILKQGAITTVLTGDYLINISDDEQTLMIQKRPEEVETDLISQLMELDHDNVITSVSKAKNGSNVVRVSPKKGRGMDYMQYADFYISTAGWLEKVDMHFNRSAMDGYGHKCDWLKLEYKNLKLAGISTEEFKLGNYVSVTGTKVTALGKYKKYKVVSSLTIE